MTRLRTAALGMALADALGGAEFSTTKSSIENLIQRKDRDLGRHMMGDQPRLWAEV